MAPYPMDCLCATHVTTEIVSIPNFLFAATQRENVRDMVRKGRQRTCAGERNPSAKLKSDQVIAIRQDNRSSCEILAEYEISSSTLWAIRHRDTWRHLP
jgi:hypothetical protein